MSVMVTGGFGHIGSWVCHELVKKGHTVLAVDRSYRDLSYLKGMEDNITHVSVDVLDQAALYNLFREHKDSLDGVIHIAGLIGGPIFAKNPRDNIYLNVMGTVNMLEVSRLFKLRRFVYISSGAVYGVRDNIPLEDEPLTPGDIYGAAKASAEFLGIQYANEFGLDFRSVRVYFAYGPGRLPSEVTPLHNAVFGCLVGDTTITLPAGADQSIDFVYIKDIARAICLVYERPELQHHQYNVSSGVCYEIPELIQKVADCAGRKVELSIGPGRIMPRGPSIDCSRLIGELGFAAEYDIAAGVEEYAEWLKNQIEAA
ncbi:MAG: NAD(P)-dependent oxidoreductase [Deltaproteobacteria bacterium]|nr:NAD(P)-dependent oxidoreductase [Deltaproteobacteria bacterium]